jgi:tetratricopeptide (TPR) repeat protein
MLGSCNSALQSFKKGQKKFENGEYELAIKEFQKSSSANYETAKSAFLIAESYRLSNRMLQAGEYYEKALTAGSRENDIRFHLAYAQKPKANMRMPPKTLRNIFRAYLARSSKTKLLLS